MAEVRRQSEYSNPKKCVFSSSAGGNKNGSNERLAALEERVKHLATKEALATVAGDVKILKWMLGVTTAGIAGIFAILMKLIFGG